MSDQAWGDEYLQTPIGDGQFIVELNRPVPIQITFTHDEWNKRNGAYGALIIEAAETDSLVRFFREAMRDAPYLTPSDERLALAYGYFVDRSIMSALVASQICGIEIVAMSKSQVMAAMNI